MQSQGLGELLKGSEKQEKKFFEGDQKRNKGVPRGGVGGYWPRVRTVGAYLCKMQTDGHRIRCHQSAKKDSEMAVFSRYMPL